MADSLPGHAEYDEVVRQRTIAAFEHEHKAVIVSVSRSMEPVSASGSRVLAPFDPSACKKIPPSDAGWRDPKLSAKTLIPTC